MLLLDLFNFAIILSSAISLSWADLGLSDSQCLALSTALLEIFHTLLCLLFEQSLIFRYQQIILDSVLSLDISYWPTINLSSWTYGRRDGHFHGLLRGVPPSFYKLTTQHALPSLQNLPTQDMSQQLYTPLTAGPNFPCPNPMCGKIFNTGDLACQHLAIPDSYCSRWAMDIINRTHGSSNVDNGEIPSPCHR